MNLKTSFILFISLSVFLTSCENNAAEQVQDSWGTVKLYGHAFSNKGFTTEEYEFVGKNVDIFTIEKRHAHKVHGAASTEVATLEAAREITKLNPDTKVLFYWNCDLVYAPLYDSLKDLEKEHPTWVMESRFKHITAAKNAFNFSEQGAQDLWVKTATEMVNDPAVGGVFIDATSKASLNKQLEIVHGLMDKLPGLILYNGYRYHPKLGFYGGPETLKHADGVFVEAFLSGPVDSAETASKLLDGLISIPEEKHIICNGLIDGFGSNGTHEFSLAAHLIVANAKTYYRFGKGHHFNNEFMTYWHEDFGKKIGAPKSKAVKEGYVYKRSFQHVDVTLDLENQTAVLDWKE